MDGGPSKIKDFEWFGGSRGQDECLHKGIPWTLKMFEGFAG